MGKFLQLSPELWPLIDVILYLIFRGWVSCLPAALLFCTVCISCFVWYISGIISS